MDISVEMRGHAHLQQCQLVDRNTPVVVFSVTRKRMFVRSGGLHECIALRLCKPRHAVCVSGLRRDLVEAIWLVDRCSSRCDAEPRRHRICDIAGEDARQRVRGVGASLQVEHQPVRVAGGVHSEVL